MSTTVWSEDYRMWVPRGYALQDSWFRLTPTTGTVGCWGITGTIAVDVVNGIVLEPDYRFPNPMASSYYGVPCFRSCADGFLTAADTRLALAGDMTIELIVQRNSRLDLLSAFSSYVGPTNLLQSHNKLYATGTGGYGTTLRWVQEFGNGSILEFDGGIGADIGNPLYFATSRSGLAVDLYCNARLGHSVVLPYAADGGDSTDCRLCCGGSIDAGVYTGSRGMSFFSLCITGRALSAAEIRARYIATLGNFYA